MKHQQHYRTLHRKLTTGSHGRSTTTDTET